jgi:hypothetical protein
MPMYMDVHERLPHGTTTKDMAEAHRADLEIQQRHGVRYLRYWVDEEAGKLFCLAEAPSAEAAAMVHRQAHGLLADRVYQVQEGA